MTPITATPGLPGYSTDIVDQSSAGSVAGDTTTAFVLGFTERGPIVPTLVRSLGEYVRIFGDRVSYGFLYDTLDIAFREELAQAYVQRVVGPTPVNATNNLFDQAGSVSPGDVSLIATSKNPGEGDNALNVEAVFAANTVYFKVSDDVRGQLETSPVFTTRAAAAAWTSNYVTLTLGTSTELPRSQVVSLAGGAGDHTAATDTQWAAALAKITKDYGPGQVAMPGRTSDVAHVQIAGHCAAFYRNGILDIDDTATVTELVADAAAITTGDRFCAAFGPWAIVPGIAAGTTRTVPYSAIQLGLIARVERENGDNSNIAAAGERYPSKTALGLTQAAFSDADRQTLNAAGYNLARVIDGNVVTYGYRSLADPTNDPEWVQFSGSREVCALAADANVVIREFVFQQIDGRGLKIAEMGGLVTGVCSRHYALGALFGATPEAAFNVDTGPSVNTTASIAAGQLKAAVQVRTSPFAEQVEVLITHVSSAEAL